jgi:hypothetical protein
MVFRAKHAPESSPAIGIQAILDFRFAETTEQAPSARGSLIFSISQPEIGY